MAYKITFVILLYFLEPGVGSSSRVSNMSSSSIQVTLNRLYPVISTTNGVYVTSVLDNVRTFVIEGGQSTLNSDITLAVSVTSVLCQSSKPTQTVQASVCGSVQTHLSNSLYNLRSSSDIVLATPTRIPDKRNAIHIDYKLILCVVVPLLSILVFVMVVAVLLCIRRYRKLRRYRQHLVPLTDMDGSDDSDDDQVDDEEPVFMVSSISSSAKPVLSFQNDND